MTSSNPQTSSSKHSPRQSQRSATESRREFVFLTRTDPPVWQRTGVRTRSGTGSSRNTASAHPAKSSVVRRAGRSSLSGPDLPTQRSPAIYAPVEGEALAVADALDKARHFVLGCSDLQIAVDHKPPLKLFGDRSLEDISNTRLRNLKHYATDSGWCTSLA